MCVYKKISFALIVFVLLLTTGVPASTEEGDDSAEIPTTEATTEAATVPTTENLLWCRVPRKSRR